ncbi:MAG: hypothetical protein U7126_07740 [Microcoleus sp.]
MAVNPKSLKNLRAIGNSKQLRVKIRRSPLHYLDKRRSPFVNLAETPSAYFSEAMVRF